MKVLIVGLGAVGCGLARALRSADPSIVVVGADRDQDTVIRAIGQSFVIGEGQGDGCDLAFICVPLSEIASATKAALGAQTIICTASVQVPAARILQEAYQGSWLLAHPMARDEMQGADWSLTRVCEPLLEVISKIGGRITVQDPDAHDHEVALTSHLPQLIAQELQAMNPHPSIAGPGWKRATLRAHEQPELWDEIFAANREAVLEQVSELASRLKRRLQE